MGSLVRLRPRHSTDYVTQSRTVLATARDGTIDGRDGHGLFVHETRVLSCLRYRVNGALPATVALSNVEQHSWLAYYTAPAPDTRHAKDSGSGQMTSLSEETTEIRVSRSVGRGMHEDLDVVNFTGRRAEFELAVELDADFADLVEAGDERRQHGSLDRAWRASDRGGTLTFHYRARHEYDHQGDRGTKTIDRGIAIHVASASSAPRYADGALRFAIALDPGGAWHTCLLFAPWIEDVRLRPTRACYAFGAGEGAFGERRAIFLREATGLTSPEHATLTATAHAAFEQAKRDLAALRLYDLDHGDRAWTLAAGVPLYVALFGRDTLTTAWQAALAGPELMHGTLAELEKWQGTRVDDWRDEQPGRMLHEAHTGPLEVLNFNPRERYYGSVTSAALYPVVLGELWHWTGREDLVRPFVRPALDGLRWLDEWSDRDHDGFYDYLTRSTRA
jgi:glycogen debranching enzyme